MDVDQDTPEQGTPPGTPFNESFTPSTTRGQPSVNPTRRVHTKNLFTPLCTESQKTDHTNVNTNQQPPIPTDTRDGEMDVAAAAKAEGSEPAAAAATKRQATDDMEVEATAAESVVIIARLDA